MRRKNDGPDDGFGDHLLVRQRHRRLVESAPLLFGN